MEYKIKLSLEEKSVIQSCLLLGKSKLESSQDIFHKNMSNQIEKIYDKLDKAKEITSNGF